jgi:PAS domain S-box-containing protein
MTSPKDPGPENPPEAPRGDRPVESRAALCEATLNSQPVQLCVLDQRGTILMVNRAWDFAAGTAVSSSGFRIGGNYAAALERGRAPEDPYSEEEAEGLADVLSGRRKAFSIEYPKPEPLRTRWYLLSITPLVVEGALAGAVLSRSDTTARRRVEEELTTLYKAIDASIEGLALFTPEGRSRFMNAAFAHAHGYDASVELAAREWEDLYPREEVARLEGEILPQLKRLGYWSGEMRCRLKGGGAFLGEVSFTLIARGEVIICSVRDISERKRAEAALRESELKFRGIFETIQEGIIVVDPEGPALLAANRACYEMFGYAPDADIASVDILRHVAAEDRERLVRHLRHILEDVPHQHISFRLSRTDGSYLWADTIGTRTEFGGRPAALVAVNDVTAWVESQAALGRSESMLSAIFENVRDVVFFKDTQLRYLKANRTLSEVIGRPVEEILGATDDMLFGAEDAAIQGASDRRALAGEVVEEETPKTVNGSRRSFHVIKAPIRDGVGRVVGVCGIARDTTDRVLAEQTMERRDLFLSKVATASRELLVNADFSGAADVALRLLGEAVDADRVYLYEIHRAVGSEERVLSQRFEWTSEFARPQIANPAYQNIPLGHPLASLWRPVLEESGWVRQVVSGLPEEHRAIFAANGTRSLMVAPVQCGGELWGCVGFSDCRAERDWSRNEEWILSAFAASIGGALQRRQTERRLKESQSRMRFLLDNAPGRVFYVHDRDYNFEYLSPNIESVTGYTVEEMRRHVNHPGVGGPINEEAERIFTRIVKDGIAPPPFRWQIRHRDGRILDFWVKESPVVEGGKVTAVLGVMWPVEEGKEP